MDVSADSIRRSRQTSPVIEMGAGGAEQLVKQLENEAKDTLALVIEKRPDQARQSVLRTYMTLAPVQQAMAQAMQQMFELKNQLIQVAETT